MKPNYEFTLGDPGDHDYETPLPTRVPSPRVAPGDPFFGNDWEAGLMASEFMVQYSAKDVERAERLAKYSLFENHPEVRHA